MIKKKRKLRLRFRSAFKKRRMMLAKSLTVLPHIFTFGNAFFGFVSLIFSARGDWASAVYCILIGALMDALDGRIARLVGSASAFGVQLDSLCDVVSFCIAPAFLFYFRFLQDFGPLGILASAIYVIAGIFRLARFSLISDQQSIYFLGLPTTAAACFLVALSICLKRTLLSESVLLVLFLVILAIAGLMVSSVPFPTFKQRILGFKRHTQIIAAGAAFIAIFRFKVTLLVGIGLYTLLPAVIAVYKRVRVKLSK